MRARCFPRYVILSVTWLLLSSCGQQRSGAESETESSSRPARSSSARARKAAASSAPSAASATAASPATPAAPVVRCSATGDAPTVLGDFEGMPTVAAVDSSRLFWAEQEVPAAKEITVRSVNKDGTDPKVLAKFPGGRPQGLAVDGATVYVSADGKVSAIARDGGAPTELAKDVSGEVAARGGVVYAFRFDAAAKQDQLIAITGGKVEVLSTWPRAREFADVGALSLDDEGAVIFLEAHGIARLDPKTKTKQTIVVKSKGRDRQAYGSIPVVARGGQLAIPELGVAPAAGGELAGPGLKGPLALFGHSLVGLEITNDDIGGASPAALVQASITTEKKKTLGTMAGFFGAITGDDACVYVLNPIRGKKSAVEAYAVAELR